MHRLSTPLRSTRALPALLFAACLAPMLAAPSPAAETVKFRFNPPVPLTYKETLKVTRIDEAPQGTSREFVTVARSTVELDRSGDGYTMTVRPEGIRQLRNNREVKIPGNPIEDVVQNSVFVYTLDADGALVSVSGQEEVMRRLQALIMGLMERTPEARRPQFAATAKIFVDMVQPEAVLARMQAEWGARVSDFSGAELEVGQTLVSQSDFALPNQQSVRYYNVLRFEELVDGPAGRLARLTYQYDTDAAALKDFAGRMIEGLGGPSPTSTQIRGGGDRLIDPATLLIQSETQRREIVMEIPGPDGAPVRATRNEVRDYTYEYPPAPAAH